MSECLKIILGGFCPFIGFCILLGMLVGLVFRCWNRFLRMLNIRKHGWPPPWCDADGDLLAKATKEHH